MTGAVDGAKGSCMFIGGKPGTGKTSTVNDVMRCLNSERKQGLIPYFRFLTINGLRLSAPNRAHCCLYEVHSSATLLRPETFLCETLGDSVVVVHSKPSVLQSVRGARYCKTCTVLLVQSNLGPSKLSGTLYDRNVSIIGTI